MSGDVQFSGTPEEWDALVKKSRQNKLLTEIMAEDAKDGLYKKQTAVEWLEEELADNLKLIILNNDYTLMEKLFQQAKAMEKQQIVDTHYHARIFEREYQSVKLYKDTAEQYYKEKYGE